MPSSQATYAETRRAAADYIQAHPDDFIPFLPSLEGEDSAGATESGLMSQQEFEAYCAKIRDTAVCRLPIWGYNVTLGRIFGPKSEPAEVMEHEAAEDVAELLVENDEDDSDAPPQRTPSTDSAEDYEMVDTSNSVEDLAKKATGSQSQASKAKKRNKKR